MMVESTIYDNDRIYIPILGSKDRCCLVWIEEENTEDFLKRATEQEIVVPWSSFTVFSNDQEDLDEDAIGNFDVVVYDVICSESKKKYHMVSYGDFSDYSDLAHCICLHYNVFNLMIFYKEYLLPFCNKSYFHG